MDNKTMFFLITSSVVAVVCAVALIAVFLINSQFKPSEDTMNAETDITVDLQNQQSLVGGTSVQSDIQTTEGKYYRELTAVADSGYVFAYWRNSTTKLCGDEKITLGAASLDALSSAVSSCTPVFVAQSNVVTISNTTEFNQTIVADTASDATEGKIYKLTSDISGLTISSSLGVFRGVFDGNNHSISFGTLSGSGLFSSVNGGVIKNLIISDGVVSGAEPVFVGAFCGSINNGLLSRCLSYANVSNTIAGGYAGGLVGVCSSTDVRSMLFSCGFYGSVTAENPQQMIAKNGTLTGSTTESCAVFRPKTEGAIYVR